MKGDHTYESMPDDIMYGFVVDLRHDAERLHTLR